MPVLGDMLYQGLSDMVTFVQRSERSDIQIPG